MSMLLNVILIVRISENHEVPMKIQGRSKLISSSITVVRLQLEINIDMRFTCSILLVTYPKKSTNVFMVSLEDIITEMFADVESIFSIRKQGRG